MAATSRSAWIEAWEADLRPSPAAQRSAARVEARMRSLRYYGVGATARVPQPLSPPQREVPAPALRVVTRRRRRWPLVALGFLLAALFLGGTVISPMLLSSAVTDVESAGAKAEALERELSADIAVLSAKISALGAPDRVAELAAQLGLRPAEKVHYVDADGMPAEVDTETVVAGR